MSINTTTSLLQYLPSSLLTSMAANAKNNPNQLAALLKGFTANNSGGSGANSSFLSGLSTGASSSQYSDPFLQAMSGDDDSDSEDSNSLMSLFQMSPALMPYNASGAISTTPSGGSTVSLSG